MFNEAMKNKGWKRKIGESSDENDVDYEHVRKERIARNEEYISTLGLGNK
jgi:ketosteroid isomerase-like protein